MSWAYVPFTEARRQHLIDQGLAFSKSLCCRDSQYRTRKYEELAARVEECRKAPAVACRWTSMDLRSGMSACARPRYGQQSVDHGRVCLVTVISI